MTATNLMIWTEFYIFSRYCLTCPGAIFALGYSFFIQSYSIIAFRCVMCRHFLSQIDKTQPTSAQTLIGVKNSIMLICNLYNLLCGSESQNGRSDCAPDVIEEKEHIVIVPEKFKDNVERLCNYCGVELRSGLCIEIELSELLEILPRERRRKHSNDYPKAFQRTKRNCGSKFPSITRSCAFLRG